MEHQLRNVLAEVEFVTVAASERAGHGDATAYPDRNRG
jgi:hypothetical protein